MCRANNTALIKLGDMQWTTFDALEIHFSHTKGDQLGDEAQFSRHVFANSSDPLTSPIFALACYFSCCFNSEQTANNYLFPGTRQLDRFSSLLERMLNEKRDELALLGFSPKDIGTHSIRKGAISFLASLPGGPSTASICIWAGWTQGKVKDIYMRYVSNGDQFVGRCLTLLPLLKMEFACLPPQFLDDVDNNWISEVKRSEFPNLVNVDGFGRLIVMCLASLLHHREFVLSLDTNHVVRVCSRCFMDVTVGSFLDSNTATVVTYPWNDNLHHYSGIPPHVSTLQELTIVKQEQRGLVIDFVEKMKTVLDERGIEGGRLTLAQLTTTLNEALTGIRQRLDTIDGRTHGNSNNANNTGEFEQVETGQHAYTLHYHHGKYRRVPGDWRWPRIGIHNAWRQWWIGDTVRNIPPLRYVERDDIEFLDGLPIGEVEAPGRSGQYSRNRRPARKILADYRFLMKYVIRQVEKKNKYQDIDIRPSTVDAMFRAVEEEFKGRRRNTQKKWISFVTECRKKLAAEKEEQQSNNREVEDDSDEE